jgi:tetratricopeptide (TPR) repeat protein
VLGNLKLLLHLYRRPFSAAGRILDEGRLAFAICAAIITALLVHVPAKDRSREQLRIESAAELSNAANEEIAGEESRRPAVLSRAVAAMISLDPGSTFGALVAIALIYVPACIFTLVLWESPGSFSTILLRDYLPLLVCILMCWTGAYLPFAIIGNAVKAAGGILPAPLWALPFAGFLLFSAGAVRVVFGAGLLRAALACAIAALAATGGLALYLVGGAYFSYLASPFLIYYVYRLFQDDLRVIGTGLRSRQSFRRHLESAAINPHDADAQYQLGLIHLQRRQVSEAAARFEKAVSIDDTETDAHFQLGRIRREQGSLDQALGHLRRAAALDDKHSTSEVWRELGATLFTAGRYAEAVDALAKYTGRRPYDPEGLVWYGSTLAALGRVDDARVAFESAVEAARTMPRHRRAQSSRWAAKARSELRALGAGTPRTSRRHHAG